MNDIATRYSVAPLQASWIVMSPATGYMCLCVLSFGFVIPGAFSQWSVDDEGCRTPDRGTGNCVPLSECQPMIDLLKTIARPIPPDVSRKIQSYTCGSSDEGVKVCCPSGPINIGVKPRVTLFQHRVEPPDVTNHPNVNLLPKYCGFLDTAIRIVNGNNSAINEFPWMALLKYHLIKKNISDFRCGGTIINKNYILTAAHCIPDTNDRKLISVRVGEHSIKNETDCERQSSKKTVCNPPVQDLAIEEAIPHPQFGGKTGGFVNDIALLRVATMNLDVVNARPVCMPIGVVRDWPFRRVIVTGWGVTNPWTGQTADILQKVGLPVADKDACAKTYRETGINLTNTQICAGGENEKDSCGGDSGGPMLVPTPVGENLNLIYVQQGVVSFGPRICANDNYPGIYTAVKYYMDWILDNMKE